MLIATRRSPLMPLTEQQLLVLMDVYAGRSNAEIEARHGINHQRMKNVLCGAYKRLEAARLIPPASPRHKRTVACVWLHRLLTREIEIEQVDA